MKKDIWLRQGGRIFTYARRNKGKHVIASIVDGVKNTGNLVVSTDDKVEDIVGKEVDEGELGFIITMVEKEVKKEGR